MSDSGAAAGAAAQPTGRPRSEAMSALLARNWWAVLLRGVVAILFGLAALFLPWAALGALVLVFVIYMLADGVLAIAGAIRAARRGEHWGLLALEGVVDIVAAAVAFVLPGISLLVFAALLAIWAVVSGVLMTASAVRLKRDHGRGWLLLGGVASIVWGVLLALFPITGLVVLTWWLGAYALVFGISLIVLALTLHRRREAPSGGHAQPA